MFWSSSVHVCILVCLVSGVFVCYASGAFALLIFCLWYLVCGIFFVVFVGVLLRGSVLVCLWNFLSAAVGGCGACLAAAFSLL